MSSIASRPPAASERRTPLTRAVLAQARLELLLLVRSGESLLVTFGVPVGILVVFSFVDALPTGADVPLDFLVPGVLAVSVMAIGLVSLAIATAFERKYGVLKLIGGSPLPAAGLLAGKVLAVLAALAAQSVIIVLVAVALGWEIKGSLGLLLLALTLGAAAFCALGLLIAGLLRAEATLAVVNALFLVLLVVSGVVFDAAELPGPVAAIGVMLPSGALGELLRGALDSPASVATVPLATLVGWTVAIAIAAARTFRFEP